MYVASPYPLFVNRSAFIKPIIIPTYNKAVAHFLTSQGGKVGICEILELARKKIPFEDKVKLAFVGWIARKGQSKSQSILPVLYTLCMFNQFKFGEVCANLFIRIPGIDNHMPLYKVISILILRTTFKTVRNAVLVCIYVSGMQSKRVRQHVFLILLYQSAHIASQARKL